MAASQVDAAALAAQLIRCPSVTPADGGALDLLQGVLEDLGFACTRLPFGEAGAERVDNLYARLGTASPNFCFAGHTDVVPPGDDAGWTTDPFAGEVREGALYGRGASDMKGAIACFVAATARFLEQRGGPPEGSISLLITGDEEGPAVNGTAKVLGWLKDNGEGLDACLVGEPTNPTALGQMIKIGCRGSLNGHITLRGSQGHAAYPDLADNPVPRLIALLGRLLERVLDEGTDHFQPSRLEVISVDVGNAAYNVIPARAEARFNIRFNDRHTSASLIEWVRGECAGAGASAEDCEAGFQVTGEAFITEPGALSDLVAGAVESVTGARPELSTSGGTSDARFIKDHCPVVEFGLLGSTMHKADEHIALGDLERLTEIYTAVLERSFPG